MYNIGIHAVNYNTLDIGHGRINKQRLKKYIQLQ